MKPSCPLRAGAARAKRAALVLALVASCSLTATHALASDIVRGGEVYRQHCANCHGVNGMSTFPGTPNIARLEGKLQPDRIILERIRMGRNAMPAYQGIISDRDLLSVIAYMRTLGR